MGAKSLKLGLKVWEILLHAGEASLVPNVWNQIVPLIVVSELDYERSIA